MARSLRSYLAAGSALVLLGGVAAAVALAGPDRPAATPQGAAAAAAGDGAAGGARTSRPAAEGSRTARPSVGAAGPLAPQLPVPVLHWTPCASGAQCAALTVPMAYHTTDPAARGQTLSVAVVRYPATGPGGRIGSLVVNPGGPGESGVSFLESSISEIPAPVRARFDVVSFDPRGTGASAAVHCLSGPQLDALIHLPPDPQNAAQEGALVGGAKEEAAACASSMGDELRHLGTYDVARDMDRLRQALGDAKLTYLGYSYGTALGAAYADLFPTRIRAMTLDGALDPAATGTDFLVGQAGGFEHEFDAWLSWCAATPSCAFRSYGGASASAGSLGTAYLALRAAVQAHPLPVGSRSVGPGEFANGVLVTLYDRANGWPALGRELAADEQRQGYLTLSFSDAFDQRSPDGTYSSLYEANSAVNCLDRPWPRHPADYAALAHQLAGRFPYFGALIAWSGLTCAYWPVSPTTLPHPVHAPGAPPILVIATTGDPATPYADGVALARELDSGVLLTHVGDGHTVYRAPGDACINQIVDDYLVALAAPPRTHPPTCS